MGGGGPRNRGRGGGYSKSSREKLQLTAEEKLEAKLGLDLFSEGDKRLGWLLTLATSSWEDRESGRIYSCVDLYFVTQDGSTFKTKYKFAPYFYVGTKDTMQRDVEEYLWRRHEGQIASIKIVDKEDLDLKNHLSGLQKSYLKISFDTVQQLTHVKYDLVQIVERNQAKVDTLDAYESIFNGKSKERPQDFIDCITDLREYDVPYHVRFSIDIDVRCGQWYDVSISSTGVTLEKRTDLLQRAEVCVCAFDIETTKLPLKFPDAEYDLVMMISYMVDGRGYLIINRQCVGEDIEDVEYTPKPEFEGCFKVINVQNEVELLQYWFNHMREVKPNIYVTYNGDFFDWPFLEKRAKHHGLEMNEEIGFQCDINQGECRAKFSCHLDCFAWVKRDSYLPQGSHGLKAVTKSKLGYDPVEVNPEDMVRLAMEQPQRMASYSVSDAVATYYLYKTYVHPFIFSLATIIPMPPDEVLRKGSGTLCEMLLMVQAYKANVICPNKHRDDPEKFYKNHPLESETYIGGHVECLESGVFRSDLPTRFDLDPSAFDQLINNLDRDLQYAITVEGKLDVKSISNYEEVKGAIMEKLVALRETPFREECPLIYHLDVAAMYPNIILTNRLQPPSIVTDEVCTACDFNRPGKNCLRKLEWVWRGEVYMAKKSDYYHLKKQIEFESNEKDGLSSHSLLDVSKGGQISKLKERLKKYCQKAYRRVLDKPITEVREAGICMRENPFYVDTVRSFRDRRYEYKGLNKTWKGKLTDAKASGNSMKIQEAQDMVVLYDSLQLAHKCILNSFYGYVMRKGARWYSMEMAGVVTYTGAKIIQNARLLIEKIGRPLELDTDGIWCCLPSSFPENFTFHTRDMKKKLTISYPCTMLNVDVAINNTNDQYQTLKDPLTKTYSTHSECSIEFEVDGPYKAMIIPASKEEGILIKKRYAVFNHDGTLAELKGFEIKRRGELKLIKVFQAEVFDKFLNGMTLEECYSAVASVANRWLDLLDNQGTDIADSELLDYISESSTMSKSLADYGEQKSCAVTTARRLADFLGDTMVKDKGLRCQYIVACEPQGSPVSERAIPVVIFETESEIMKFYVRKWCKISTDVDIRSIVDWSYYKQRLSSTIQKIITIPAAMQKVSNPVPRVVHPDWLYKKVSEKDDKFRQRKIKDIFHTTSCGGKSNNKATTVANKSAISFKEIHMVDIEDSLTPDISSVAGPHTFITSSKVNKENSSASGLPPDARVHCRSQQKNDTISKLNHPLLSLNQNANSGESVDRNIDYQGWLDSKKRKWKHIREEKKMHRSNKMKKPDESILRNDFDSHKLGHKHSDVTGINSYFKRSEVALVHSPWQIIQILPSSLPGHFSAWIIADSVMLKVSINVPRVFYINMKADVMTDFAGKSVSKFLPHGRTCYNLIEVAIGEEQFKAERRKFAEHLADPEVEGIYETKISLDYNAILEIGCICKPEKTTKHRYNQDSWNLNALHMKTTSQYSYLESISYIFLYHSFSDSRGLYVIYLPVSSSISVFVVNPFQNRELSSSILEKLFREACQTQTSNTQLPKSRITFKVEYFKSFDVAEKDIQRTLTAYRDARRGPCLCLSECPNLQALKSSVLALDNFPVISIPCNDVDNSYQALGWQITAGKTSMQRCAASSQWLYQRVFLSRYALVPVGNFETDWLVYTMDVMYSRALREQQQILWVSDDGVPDLGGIVEEDASFVDEVENPVFTYPGAYRRVAVEIKIHHLAVNALLKSSQVDEMEGRDLDGSDDNMLCGTDNTNDAYFDESRSCALAVRALKRMIQRCISDAVTSGNIFADAVLQNLYRWLCSPSSKLHDPALHRVVHKAMKKVFALLLVEIRKLGAAIIFANFSKIIIDTGKLDLFSARSYCDSLLKALQARDLFEWIELEPLSFWHSLLFMDQYNYGGILAKSVPESPIEDTEVASQAENAEEEPNDDIVSSWNIAESLPKEIQDHFIVIVSEFLYIPRKYSREQVSARNRKVGENCTQSITISAAETHEECVAKFLRDQISNYFTEKLLKIVQNIHLSSGTKKENERTANGTPQPIGSLVAKGNLALEFIKHVCAVLALDRHVQHDVLRMRRNLLRLVHVKEFAPEAQFRNVCQSFILPNVICSYCNDCRDLDVCGDALLTEQNWRCSMPHCGQPYNRDQMENALLQIVRQRERLYHLQDLVCLRCKQVKSGHLAEQCACGGSYKCMEDSSEFLGKMQVISSVAKSQKFHVLQDCLSWILEAQCTVK